MDTIGRGVHCGVGGVESDGRTGWNEVAGVLTTIL